MQNSKADADERIEQIRKALLRLGGNDGVALTTLAKQLGMSRHNLRYFLFGFKTKYGIRGGHLLDEIVVKGKEGTNVIVAYKK